MEDEKQNLIKVKIARLGKKIYKNRFRIIFIVLIAALLIFFFGSNTMKIINLTKQKYQLQEDIAYEEKRSEALEEELATVGEKTYIEKIAREKLNMYYPDENVVTIEYANTQNNIKKNDEENHE